MQIIYCQQEQMMILFGLVHLRNVSIQLNLSLLIDFRCCFYRKSQYLGRDSNKVYVFASELFIFKWCVLDKTLFEDTFLERMEFIRRNHIFYENFMWALLQYKTTLKNWLYGFSFVCSIWNFFDVWLLNSLQCFQSF